MAGKTKAELLEDIRLLEGHIAALEKERAKYERLLKHETVSQEAKAIFDSYVEAGFNETQAFDILQLIMQRSRMIDDNYFANYGRGFIQYRR